MTSTTQSCNVAQYNLCIRKNNVYNLRFRRDVDGAPFNFTGFSCVFTIRATPDSAVLFTADLDDYISFATEDAVLCVVEVNIPSTITKNFFFDSAVYDLVIFTTTANVTPILYGNVIVKKGISLIEAV
jgi:hypothetical protein